MNLTNGLRCLALVLGWLLIVPGFSTVAGAAEAKYAQLNLQEVYRNSNRIKNARDDMQKMYMASAAKLNALREAFNKLQQQLTAGKDTLKQEEREKLEAELAKREQELQAEQQEIQGKIAAKQKAVETVVDGQVKEIIEKIIKQEGFAVVFKSQAIFPSPGIVDLTERVTKELDSLPALEKQQ